jgi:hypothetical protein
LKRDWSQYVIRMLRYVHTGPLNYLSTQKFISVVT